MAKVLKYGIELGYEKVDFPDFTNGQWMYRKPKFAPTDEF
jgi:hypothetical protein